MNYFQLLESYGFYGYKCNINNIVVIISKENTGFCNNTTNLIDVKTDALSYCSVLESLLSAEKTMNKAQLFISERSHMEPKNEQWLKTVMGTSETFLATSKLKPPRRQWQATPVLLPRKSRGWRSLVGCSPWGRYESDVTARLHFHFPLSRNGEGNGNALQCSCLENPRDAGA